MPWGKIFDFVLENYTICATFYAEEDAHSVGFLKKFSTSDLAIFRKSTRAKRWSQKYDHNSVQNGRIVTFFFQFDSELNSASDHTFRIGEKKFGTFL